MGVFHEPTFSSSYFRQNPIPDLLPSHLVIPAGILQHLFGNASFLRKKSR